MAECAAKTEFLSLKLPSEQVRVIEQHARQLGVSKSAVVRMLLRTGIVPTYQIHELRG
jgi:Zn-dependent peptidase ImmA (M78 family)